jgi:hypothetical protein
MLFPSSCSPPGTSLSGTIEILRVPKKNPLFAVGVVTRTR